MRAVNIQCAIPKDCVERPTLPLGLQLGNNHSERLQEKALLGAFSLQR